MEKSCSLASRKIYSKLTYFYPNINYELLISQWSLQSIHTTILVLEVIVKIETMPCIGMHNITNQYRYKYLINKHHYIHNRDILTVYIHQPQGISLWENTNQTESKAGE